VRFAIAFLAVGLVYVADRSFPKLIDDGALFLLLTTAVMATAGLAGTGPALAATLGGAAVGAWSDSIVGGANPASRTHLALFVIQGLLLTALIAELRVARRKAEQQASEAHDARHESEAASRMKDEFLATISHELRTPLNAVLGWVHLLRTGKLDTATATRGLESIDRNVRLQARLTADLLDASKALTGMLRMESRSISIVQAVYDVSSAVMPAAQAKGVRIETHVPDSTAAVLGDPSRLRQIVWHLLANAIKFTPRGGLIGIQVHTTAEHIILTVSDSGSGIAPQFLPRVFDRFTQQDASTTRSAGGLGVGLSLVREIVELHGGDITVRNRSEGTGAIFTVRLPRQSAEEPTSPPQRPIWSMLSAPLSSQFSSAPLDGVRVLVLDQDTEGRELLRAVLDQRGATVRTVASVADALEALEAWRPDALVTDSASPERDSYTVVGKVQWLEAERGGRIPAAALTAHSRTDERVRQMLEAVQRDLPKPIEPSVLASEIARLTGRERRRAARTT
jgi:signal transduction histidine kinase